MFEQSFFKNKNKFFYFLITIFIFYILFPYLSFLNGNYFLENVLTNFPVDFFDSQRIYIAEIINKTNFHYIFFINFLLFFIITFFAYKIFPKETLKENYIFGYRDKEKLLLFFQLLILICIFFLIRDIYQFFLYLNSDVYLLVGAPSHTVLDHRALVYRFIEGRIQTHFVIGSIFSIYVMKNKKYYLSVPFLLILLFFEIITFSRFYFFLICASFLILSKKKFAYAIISVILCLIFYRLIIYSQFSSLLDNLFWEPISLWCTEIIKLHNALLELKEINFIQKFIFDNLLTNFIFFDFNNSYYLFSRSTYAQFGSYANFGLIDMIAYPLQTIFLIISIYFLKKIIIKYFNLNNLFIILFVFSSFKIIRGSSMDGLAFILKFEILLVFVIIFYFLLKKLNFFKFSS